VVEDAAQALGATLHGAPLGTLGDAGAFSFHETKNITCGEGGALLVNDPGHAERAEILREKGTNRSRFFRGQVDKYSWVDVGSSYLPSELLSAVLCAQIEQADQVQQARRGLWQTYAAQLAAWAGANDVRLPIVPASCTPAYHMFHLLMPNQASRDALIAHLKARGILAVFHYLPLHTSDMGRRFGGRPGDCPHTEDISDRLVRLPFFTNMTAETQHEVIETTRQFAAVCAGPSR
jgi:dTDP-4-amino-4,6-dideoxygalactose transaminase